MIFWAERYLQHFPEMSGDDMAEPSSNERRSHPSVIEHALAIAVTAVVLEQHSRLPHVTVVTFFTAPLLIVGLLIAFLCRVFYSQNECERPMAALRSSMPHWLVLPAAILLMCSSSLTHWPASLRFALSRPGFDELIAQAQRGEKPLGFPRRVGLYWISEVSDVNYNYETGEGELDFVTGRALIDPCGLCYDRANHPTSHYLKLRIAPCWYLNEL